MNAASPTRVSYEDYFEREVQDGDVKHEWSEGVVYAMSR